MLPVVPQRADVHDEVEPREILVGDAVAAQDRDRVFRRVRMQRGRERGAVLDRRERLPYRWTPHITLGHWVTAHFRDVEVAAASLGGQCVDIGAVLAELSDRPLRLTRESEHRLADRALARK